VAAGTNLLSRAAALLPELDPERVELLPLLGGALTDAGRWPEANTVLEEGIVAARRLGDRRSEGLAVVKALWLRLHSGAFGSNVEALPDLERAMALFEDLGDDIGLAEGWILRGSIEFWVGDSERAIDAAGRALEHARRAGDARRELDALRLRSFWQLWGATPVRDALDGVDELSKAPASANPMFRSYIARLRGLLEAMNGNAGRAHELLEAAKASARELGLRIDLTAAMTASGYASMVEDDHASAETEFAEAVSLFRSMGDIGHLSSYAPSLADAVSAQGRHDEALALTEEAERVSIEGDTDAHVHWRRVRGKVLARLGHMEEALSFATRAVELARTTDDLDKIGRALLDLAEVLQLAGRSSDARAIAHEALEVFERKGNVPLASAARRLT
jgi:tetratricopeptide (TPR) repeat protein